MKIRIKSSSPEVAVVGLGLVKTNEWVEVTKAQEASFLRHRGMTLEESGYETKTATKKEAS